jgi:hypothetical protein
MARAIKNKNLTFRARGDLRDRLARMAENHDRSLSEEIENRLEMSFHYERQIKDLTDRNNALDAERRQSQRTMALLIAKSFAGLPLSASEAETVAALEQQRDQALAVVREFEQWKTGAPTKIEDQEESE